MKNCQRYTFTLILSLVVTLLYFYNKNVSDEKGFKMEIMRTDISTFKLPKWKQIGVEELGILTSENCFTKNITDIMPYKRNVWQKFNSFADEDKCDLTLYLFQPINAVKFTRRRKTVLIGVGVHIGFALDQLENSRCADMEYISWDFRHKVLPDDIKNSLIHGYSKKHLQNTQDLFWRHYHSDPDLKRADIIMCGFDVWHCLIFAPFNKKMILNSAYRFDGHISVNRENAQMLQNILYNAVRYNPDVILAGLTIYDVMYAQHFLGSHKMIPLHATGEYVHESLRKEIRDGMCKVPLNTTGYHPTQHVVSIFPKRLSPGGDKIAQEMMNYYSAKVNKSFDLKVFSRKQGRYNYCDIGKYSAVIVLGYSVMSYLMCEVASLGIPMFVPTPRLYAMWEKKHHLIPERKGSLKHEVVDDMVENPRSLHKGFNPNDDLNEVNIKHWVTYSDYYHYKGTVLFDSYEELFQKIENANLAKMNKDSIQYRVENTLINHVNWRAIDRYFFDGESEIQQQYNDSTLKEGLDIWEKKISKPGFIPKASTDKYENMETVILNYDEYISVFNGPLKCKNMSPGKRVVYYTFNKSIQRIKLDPPCYFITMTELKKIPEIERIIQTYSAVYSDRYAQLLIMLIHAIQSGSSTVVRLYPDKRSSDKSCQVAKYKSLLPRSKGWYETVFTAEQLVFAWIPIPGKRLASMWLKKSSNFTSGSTMLKCINYKHRDKLLTEADHVQLNDYLEYWISDEVESFYNLLDQLNFELAVRGYTTKFYAELHRSWMESLASYSTFKSYILNI